MSLSRFANGRTLLVTIVAAAMFGSVILWVRGGDLAGQTGGAGGACLTATPVGRQSTYSSGDFGCVHTAGTNSVLRTAVSEVPTSTDCGSFQAIDLGVNVSVIARTSTWSQGDFGCVYSCPAGYALTQVVAENPSGSADCNSFGCRYIGDGPTLPLQSTWSQGDHACVYTCPAGYALAYFVGENPTGAGDCNSSGNGCRQVSNLCASSSSTAQQSSTGLPPVSSAPSQQSSAGGGSSQGVTSSAGAGESSAGNVSSGGGSSVCSATNLLSDTFSMNCGTTGQECGAHRIKQFSVPQSGPVSAVFLGHQQQEPDGTKPAPCSSKYVHITLDGQTLPQSPLSGLNQAAIVTLFQMDLTAGTHTLDLSFTGVPGGCNAGTLVSIAGTTTVNAAGSACGSSSVSSGSSAGSGSSGGGSSSIAPKMQCEDGADNDNDARSDMSDPGCAFPKDNDETDPPPDILICTNGSSSSAPGGSSSSGGASSGAGSSASGSGSSGASSSLRPGPGCGDGEPVPPEQCDDGNNISGDGCSATCTLEPGNHLACVSDQCQVVQGAGQNTCSTDANCDGSTCGNGDLDNGEECDLGPQNGQPNSGCSLTCELDGCTPGELCPNGEVCPANGQCPDLCPNGVVDPGEDCDDGNQNNTDQCTNSCLLSCNAGQLCPDGQTCPQNGVCPASCGNGDLDNGEECDLGDLNGQPNSGCTDSCELDGCTPGDLCPNGAICPENGQCPDLCPNGVIDSPQEMCDDGNQNDDDECSNSCLITCEQGELCPDGQTCPQNGVCPASCGNGDLDNGEECDLGDLNGQPNSGCTDSCELDGCTPGDLCPNGAICPENGQCPDLCPNGVVDPGEDCDDGNQNDDDECSNSCLITCEQGELCPDGSVCPENGICPQTCGDGDIDNGEECDLGDLNGQPNSGCTATCELGGCTPGDLCPNGAICPEDGQCPDLCPNGEANPPQEECDDGNTDDGDGCSNSCLLPGSVCGDGVQDHDEQCDDGNVTNGDGCSIQCVIECTRNDQCPSNQCVDGLCEGICGDNIQDIDEQCDDGNVTDGDGCNGQCIIECADNNQCPSGQCMNGTCTEVCGDGVLDRLNEQCDDGNRTDGDGCNNQCIVECSNSNQCGGGQCVEGLCIPICGNHEMEEGEQCDDGNVAPQDGCDGDCVLECTVDAECPMGDCINGRCNGICGDGVKEPVEQCDDGNLRGSDGCSMQCILECTADNQCPSGQCVGGFCAGECGNQVLDAGEACDDGNDVDDDACTNLCKLGDRTPCRLPEQCGSNICLNGFCEPCDSTDQCPTGMLCLERRCVENPVCPNGVRELGESCDDGNQSDTDRCSNMCRKGNGEECGKNRECASLLCLDGACTACTADNQCPSGKCIAGRCLDLCGNGRIDAGEDCDAGAQNNDVLPDHCRRSCERPGCGDGVQDAGEQCDDGNQNDADGCTQLCRKAQVQSQFGTGIPGARCTGNNQCASGLCIDGYCTAQACTLDSDCPSGQCRNGFCAVQACTENSQCPSGLCVNGYCTGRPAGAVCADNTQCASGLCVNGICSRWNALVANVATSNAPRGDTGPAAIAVMGAGAAAGWAWMRRRRKFAG